MIIRLAVSMPGTSQMKFIDDCDEETLKELNDSMAVLTTLFPQVGPQVLREMLQTFDGKNCLHIIAEQLLNDQDRWVKGRWRRVKNEKEASKDDQILVTADDLFRRASYKSAVRTTLYEEFKALGTSKIERILVEHNFCYTRARLNLHNVASRSWRNNFNFFSLKWLKSSHAIAGAHPMMSWRKSPDDGTNLIPVLKGTGDEELDLELHRNVLLPFLQEAKKKREDRDWETAMKLNEAEAMSVQAMYECQCCFSDTTFEQMATCTTSAHVLCFQCIENAVSAALYGQSWGRNIECRQSLLKCLAPMPDDRCDGCISHSATCRALLQSKGGQEALTKFETLLAEESITKADLALVHCPFCPYAEVDEPYLPPSLVRYRLNTRDIKVTAPLILLLLSSTPLLFLYDLTTRLPMFHKLPRITKMVSKSLARLFRSRHLSQRFQCRAPLCSLRSCLTCSKIWHDPHICHESAMLSLRTTIEAARTKALKRTCPRCGLSFIKESGCNKLTCVCGYVMCYSCRQGLGLGHGGEGYRHFCQHFRPSGGICKDCDKCDLYKDENDEVLVEQAGVLAEKEWREKEGMTDVVGIGGHQNEIRRTTWLETYWTWQDIIDWCVQNMIDC